MTVLALLTEKQTFFDANSNELSGGKLFVYLAGTNTKATSYAETDGLSANSNPIVLNSRGEVPNGLYVAPGATYKLVLAPATDTDPPTSPIWTRDNLTPTNDVTAASATEWVSSAVVATQINATQFSVPGDQRTTFQVGRRVQAASTAGTRYGTVSVASFGAGITTITLSPLSGNLDAGLTGTTPFVGLLTSTNPAVPEVDDSVFRIPNSADRTKEARFDVSLVPTGVTRTLYLGLPSSGKNSGYALAESDYGAALFCTSSFTLTLTTSLGAGFQVWIKNIGTGTITLSPSSGSIFFPGAANAGAASATLPYSGSTEGPYNVSGVLLQCDGTNWHVIATSEAHGEQLFTSSGSWVAPAGVTTIWLDGSAQGGGGGGTGTNAGSAGGGGGGGQAIKSARYSVVPGTTYTITLANTGGVGSTGGSGSNGTAGSNAQFDTLVTLVGGSGGAYSNGPVGAGGAAGGAGATAGGAGFAITTNVSLGGVGGGSIFGANAAPLIGGSVNGGSAAGYGAGGNGGVSVGSNQNGGNGAPGFFAVRW